MRSLVIFSSAYLLLFVLHILFAAKDWHLLFQGVAIVLVLMTFCCGALLWLIDYRLKKTMSKSTTTGYVVSLPLAVGIAYAYTGMEFQIVASVGALLLTTLTHGGWFVFVKEK